MPGNDSTTYEVEYDLLSSEWCTSNGASGSPAYSTAPTDLGYTDNATHDVSVALTGLSPDVEYCAELTATNVEGSYASGQVTWWQGEPEIDATSASVSGQTTATVEGQINPHHQNASYHVAFGPANSEWCLSSGASGTPAGSSGTDLVGAADDTFHTVSSNLNGLTLGATYCASLVTNSGYDEVVYGPQVTWTESEPDAVTFDAYSTDGSSATVEGLVNTGGDPTTTYQVQYDLAGTEWCTSDGASGSPANTTAATSEGLDPTSTDYQFVSVDLSGLAEGDDYCAQIVASNSDGNVDGGQVTWTQGVPTADTFDGFSSGDSTATVEGDVNAATQSTSYVVEYDLDTSDWCTTDGASGAPGSTTGPQVLASTDGSFHDVSVNLTGLTPGAGYCAEIVASNGTGSTPNDDGDQVFWTQPTPPPKPTLTVTTGGLGTGTVTSSPSGIDCGSACSSSFASGTQVTLSATAAPGSVFEAWSGGGCGPASGTGTCKVTMSADTTVSAIFGKVATITRTLSVSLTGATTAGMVTSSPAGIDCGSTCVHAFDTGTRVTLTATATQGSFTGWSGAGCSGTGTCTVTLNSDVTVSANFSSSPAPLPTCVVPSLKGKKLAAARTAITRRHCRVGRIRRTYSAKTRKGRVISQKPRPGSKHRRGTKVSLVLSKGKKP